MTSADRTILYGMSPAELRALCVQLEVKPVHAEQLAAFIFRKGISDPALIPDLPETLRHYLRHHVAWPVVTCVADRQSADGTRKLLLAMQDGKEVETVLIPGKGRLTQCISTQVGCAVGCSFCLTATAGLTRNLTAAEMTLQVMTGERLSHGKVRNLVLMGMGEPLHNYEEVAKFVRIATDPKGMAFSPNRITLSTSGLIPGIHRMMEEELPCNLALSLNATTDEVRSAIMPVNRKYPIAELMQAVREYIDRRGGKRVLIEYVLLGGINDSLADAMRLCELLKGLDCTVNLLPFNAFPGSPFQRPADSDVSAFRQVLIQASIVAVVRESRGRDISAACGQLKTEISERRRAA